MGKSGRKGLVTSRSTAELSEGSEQEGQSSKDNGKLGKGRSKIPGKGEGSDHSDNENKNRHGKATKDDQATSLRVRGPEEGKKSRKAKLFNKGLLVRSVLLVNLAILKKN